MSQLDLLPVPAKVWAHRVVTVHLEHPESPVAYNLCGSGTTRDDPNTEDENQITCLNCLLHLERGTRAEL